MSGTTAQPTMGLSNITASPTSTLLGIGMLASGAAQALTVLPVGPAGWATFALQLIAGLAGLFGK